MNIDSNNSVKFRDIFPAIAGLDMGVEELELSIRSYNSLKRVDVHTLQQLLSMSMDELIRTNPDRNYDEIPLMLRELSDSQSSSPGRSNKEQTALEGEDLLGG